MKPLSGSGTIERLPSGRHRVRLRFADGTRGDSRLFDAHDAAVRFRDDAMVRARTGDLTVLGARTLLTFGPGVLDARELEGVRSIASKRGTWRQHVSTAPIASALLTAIATEQIEAWLEMLKAKRACAPAPWRPARGAGLLAPPHRPRSARAEITRRPALRATLYSVDRAAATAVGGARSQVDARAVARRVGRIGEPVAVVVDLLHATSQIAVSARADRAAARDAGAQPVAGRGAIRALLAGHRAASDHQAHARDTLRVCGARCAERASVERGGVAGHERVERTRGAVGAARPRGPAALDTKSEREHARPAREGDGASSAGDLELASLSRASIGDDAHADSRSGVVT